MRIILLLCLFPFAIAAQTDCGDTPEFNQRIVDIASAEMNKKVGTGECWDLAQLVLDETGANWDGYEVFGTEINHKNECIYAGDIIQFKNVKITWEEGKYTYEEEMKHHTAIVHEVLEDGNIVLIHQNTGQHGRKVGTTLFRINDMKKGKITVYRPQESTE
ncbi:MAG: CHAP domain-containing protein [bacterium]|nr:CHAP domain-containing protein [bacterium]